MRHVCYVSLLFIFGLCCACGHVPNAETFYFKLKHETALYEKPADLISQFQALSPDDQDGEKGQLLRCRMVRGQLMVADAYNYKDRDSGRVALHKIIKGYEHSHAQFEQTCRDFIRTPLGQQFINAQDNEITKISSTEP